MMSCVIPYKWPQAIPTIYAYTGRGNRSIIVLYRSISPHRQRANLISVERMWLSFDEYNDPAIVIDSFLHPDVFDWRSEGAKGYLKLYIGRWEYPSDFDAVGQCAELVVFDPAWPEGIVWGTMRVLWPYSGPISV